MPTHIADLSCVTNYEVNLEFTSPMAPSLIANGEIPLISVATEIKANSFSKEGAEIHQTS